MEILRFRDASGNAHAVTTTNPLPVTTGGAGVSDAGGSFTKQKPLTHTNRSATVTTTSAQVAPANATRTKLLINNLDATNPIFLNLGAAATAGAGSIRVGPLGVLELSGTTAALNAISTGASVAATIWEF